MHISISILPLLLVTALATTPCYFPNGTAEGNLVPCNGTASVSACCAPGDTCVSNGLCKNSGDGSNDFFWRDGCTDANWGVGCPRYCIDTTFDSNAPSTNYLIKSCNTDNTLYCCSYGSDDCCSNSTLTFTAPSAVLFAPISATSTSSSSSATGASPTGASSSTAASSSSTSTPGAVQQSTSDTSDGGLSTGATAGIGVGVALGVIAVVCIGVAIWWFKRKSRRGQQSEKSAAWTSETAATPYQPPPYESARVDASELDSRDGGHVAAKYHGPQSGSTGFNAHELESRGVHEASAGGMPSEMAGDSGYRAYRP